MNLTTAEEFINRGKEIYAMENYGVSDLYAIAYTLIQETPSEPMPDAQKH